MPAYPRPTMRINVAPTGSTRFRLEIADGVFTRKRGQKLIVLQIEWRADILDCTSKAVSSSETWWHDATPEDLMNRSIAPPVIGVLEQITLGKPE